VNTYDFSVRAADGSVTDLRDYAGQVLLIVNVASKCGFTPQYAGLESLYRGGKDRGLRILGFPCDQFGGQEPGTDAEIQEFCSTNYQVTFRKTVRGPGGPGVAEVALRSGRLLGMSARPSPGCPDC
jgi:glutathione peroxidase